MSFETKFRKWFVFWSWTGFHPVNSYNSKSWNFGPIHVGWRRLPVRFVGRPTLKVLDI